MVLMFIFSPLMAKICSILNVPIRLFAPIATVHDSDIIVNIEQQFLSVASSRHTPRRFVSYNQAHLEKLKNAST